MIVTKAFYLAQIQAWKSIWTKRANGICTYGSCPACILTEEYFDLGIKGAWLPIAYICEPCCPVNYDYLQVSDWKYCMNPRSRYLIWDQFGSTERAKEILNNTVFYSYEEWVERCKNYSGKIPDVNNMEEL